MLPCDPKGSPSLSDAPALSPEASAGYLQGEASQGSLGTASGDLVLLLLCHAVTHPYIHTCIYLFITFFAHSYLEGRGHTMLNSPLYVQAMSRRREQRGNGSRASGTPASSRVVMHRGALGACPHTALSWNAGTRCDSCNASVMVGQHAQTKQHRPTRPISPPTSHSATFRNPLCCQA